MTDDADRALDRALMARGAGETRPLGSAALGRVRAWLRQTAPGDWARVVGVHDAVLTDDITTVLSALDALDLAAARLENERAAERTRADAAEAERARLTTELDAARRAATFAEMERDTLRGLTDAMRADNVRLRGIVAGRETAPTGAELTAHHDEGGQWLVIRAASPRSIVDTLRSVTDVRAWARSGTPLRWLPLDASGRPCPWPTVALDAAGEGR